ncbi:MAG: antirestriction protein ArdA [Cohaesibacter sp.]|nr:antirestriction protein ArdA [Cohaesibacter sp.]
MTVTFYAQPYDIDATGFHFSDAETYKETIGKIVNRYGDQVEEFEIQFIDGDAIDAELFKALCISQVTILPFMEKLEEWEDWNKTDIVIAVGECGYSFDLESDDPNDLDIDLYAGMDLNDLAHQFVAEGLFGDIPERLTNYLDYDAIARDLGHDYAETTITGETCVYRMA